MSADENARHAASEVLNRYHLSEVSLDNLIYLIEEEGYELIEFSAESANEDQVILQLDLVSFAVNAKAFTYKSNDLKYVFIRDDLSANEKLRALAHEEGHIACGHLEKKNVSPDDVSDEYEANEFAHYLLHPSILHKTKAFVHEHKRLILFVSLLAICVAIAVPCTLHLAKEKEYFGEYYVTENGEKYHDENCIYIKDKSNVHRLTIEEYESGEFEPCQICLPENKEGQK